MEEWIRVKVVGVEGGRWDSGGVRRAGGGGMGWKGGHGEGEGGDDNGWVKMFRKWS